jgi:hypothetical protein
MSSGRYAPILWSPEAGHEIGLFPSAGKPARLAVSNTITTSGLGSDSNIVSGELLVRRSAGCMSKPGLRSTRKLYWLT